MQGKTMVTVAAVAALLGAPLQAQDRFTAIYGYGGGYSPLADLTAAGSEDFKTGFNVGAGLSFTLNRLVAFRGDLTLVQSQQRGAATPADWRKLFAAADVVLRLPMGQLTPYLSAGGGVVTMDQKGTGTALSSRRGARFGLGVSYDLPTGLGLFVQGLAWLYRWDKTKYPTYTETQIDALYSVGVSYRFPL